MKLINRVKNGSMVGLVREWSEHFRKVFGPSATNAQNNDGQEKTDLHSLRSTEFNLILRHFNANVFFSDIMNE